MGMKEPLLTSVVLLEKMFKSQSSGSTMPTSLARFDSPLEENIHQLRINDDLSMAYVKTTTVNNHIEDYRDSKTDWVGDDYENEVFPENDGSSVDKEATLSRKLKSWMPDYVIKLLPQQAQSARQPVYSARLGREPAVVHRSSSSDSVGTQLSLLSCSSFGSEQTNKNNRRRKKGTVTERRQSPHSAGKGSRWVELAKKRKGQLDRYMMSQVHALSQGVNLTEESEAFQLCAKDEQRALFQCGRMNKLAFAANLKKSNSMTNVNFDLHLKPKQRVVSASAKKSYGKPIDFQELRRQMLNQRLAYLSRRTTGRRPLHRTGPRHSLTSLGSNTSEVFLMAGSPRNDTPLKIPEEAAPEKQVTMWKGDQEILDIDLKKELSAKVKHRINSTTTALDRVTGVGEDNEQRLYSCRLDEFPLYTEDDFAIVPKIPQKLRISPHLSEVIKNDIKLRMGRPRYHVINSRDLEVWNRGQALDRAHRNLKVFNWLHSLKEDDFDATSLEQEVNDSPPVGDDVTLREVLFVRAVDEPDIKPLLERRKAKGYVL